MPELPNDFSSLKNQYRYSIILIYKNNGRIADGMREAGYKDPNNFQLKAKYRRLMTREDAQNYLKYISTHPDFLEQELNYFRNPPVISKKKFDVLVTGKLTESNKEFLENYFIIGDKYKAIQQTYPNQYSEYTRSAALKRASNILKTESSIEYMNMLNERSLQELFLSKSKIIKDVYDLAKECKDSKSRFAAVKAYELLARMTGLLQDNKSVNINDGGKIEINYIVPDKLDTNLHQDIDKFLKENQSGTFTDVEYEQYKKDQTNEGQEE